MYSLCVQLLHWVFLRHGTTPGGFSRGLERPVAAFGSVPTSTLASQLVCSRFFSPCAPPLSPFEREALVSVVSHLTELLRWPGTTRIHRDVCVCVRMRERIVFVHYERMVGPLLTVGSEQPCRVLGQHCCLVDGVNKNGFQCIVKN